MRKIMVTSALPYANGPIHLGHMVEYIQTDIWARFQRLRGHDCLYICGEDSHGTPVMISAENQGMTPEALIKIMHAEHLTDFTAFNINFDNYYTTHSEETRELSVSIFNKLKARGDIEIKTIEQAYDPEKKMFLPDRFVKGDCPRCGAADQYGDNCEVCGATYTTSEVKNPRSTLSNATPINKESEHYFFKLENYTTMLNQWAHAGHLQPQVANKLDEWLQYGLANWDISRDAPYFGFEIPGHTDKYFYVWLDAPIGYMASLKDLSKRRPDIKFDDYWAEDSKAELYHFVGKDIVYFHALFWPAMLTGAGYRTPTAVFAHGYLTVDGAKMSKSRGTFIKARTYLNHLQPDYLRYYFAAKLGAGVFDIDLNFDDFMQRINADLVGKVVNIASRSAGFIHKKFAGQLADKLDDAAHFQSLVARGEEISDLFETREYSRAVRSIMELADSINQYIDEKKPWALAKEEGRENEVQLVCTQALNLFRVLLFYLAPIIPTLVQNASEFLNAPVQQWDERSKPLLNHRINPFVPLLNRIEATTIQAMQEETKQDLQLGAKADHA